MKQIVVAVLSLGVAASLEACAANEPIPPAPTQVAPRVSAAQAVDRIAAARCERAERCNSVEDADKVQRCKVTVKTDIDRDFGSHGCANGVSATDLDHCVAKLRAQDCGVIGDVTEGI